MPQLLVIAKAPVPGRSKTRLCPPCSPEQAAELAQAALADTLEAVSRTECTGRTLVLDGTAGEWLPDGFEVVAQAGGAFGERLAAAFASCSGAALLIGMDTPQITPELLGASLARLESDDCDAVIGLCPDGGYWAIGFKSHVPGAFEGVTMSTRKTGGLQIARLEDLGLRVGKLPMLSDVDYFTDAAAVAAAKPHGHFAQALEAMDTARV